MKLLIQDRYSMPDNTEMFYPRASLTLDNGTLVWLGLHQGGKAYAIATLQNGVIKKAILQGESSSKRYHRPVLLCIDNETFGVLDLDHQPSLAIYTDLTLPPLLFETGNSDILQDKYGKLRAYPVRADSNANHWHLIFSESIQSQEPRYMAKLCRNSSAQTTQNPSYFWESVFSLDQSLFPQNHFGANFTIEPELGFDPPILGNLLSDESSYTFFVEGSFSSNVNRYGMDYFSLVKTDFQGNILEKLWEKSDLMDQPGKHGVRGCFSSSKEYLILTPVFKTGDWKGKQKLYSLGQNALMEIELPRGTKGFQMIDHRGEIFYLTDYEKEILLCRCSP